MEMLGRKLWVEGRLVNGAPAVGPMEAVVVLVAICKYV